MGGLLSGLCLQDKEAYDPSFLEGEIVFGCRIPSRETYTVEYSGRGGARTTVHPCFTLDVEFRGILSPAKRIEIDSEMKSNCCLAFLWPTFVVDQFNPAAGANSFFELGTQLYRVVQDPFAEFHPASLPELVFDWSQVHSIECHPLWLFAFWIHVATLSLLWIVSNELLVHRPQFQLSDFTQAWFRINNKRYRVDGGTATVPRSTTHSTSSARAHERSQNSQTPAPTIPISPEPELWTHNYVPIYGPRVKPRTDRPDQTTASAVSANGLLRRDNSDTSSARFSAPSSVRLAPIIPAAATSPPPPRRPPPSPPPPPPPPSSSTPGRDTSATTLPPVPVPQRTNVDSDVLAAISIKMSECVVCCTAVPTIVLLPCCHQCLCEMCVMKLVEISNKCPLCRSDIDQFANSAIWM